MEEWNNPHFVSFVMGKRAGASVFNIAYDASLWTNIQNLLKPLNIHLKFSLLNIYVWDSGWKLSSDIEYNYSPKMDIYIYIVHIF